MTERKSSELLTHRANRVSSITLVIVSGLIAAIVTVLGWPVMDRILAPGPDSAALEENH